jgi:hypothetical protein
LGNPVQGPPAPAEAQDDGPPIYIASEAEGRIWQGEILENLVQIVPTVETVQASQPDHFEVVPILHEFSIVLSQDCDLFQDHDRRRAGKRSTLDNVLLCEVFRAEDLRAKVLADENLASKDWRRISANQNERFQYLSRIRSEQDLQHVGLPALALDFRIYFTVRTEELLARIAGDTRRRCRLNSPYLEHLAHRFFRFQARVALPNEHEVENAG